MVTKVIIVGYSFLSQKIKEIPKEVRVSKGTRVFWKLKYLDVPPVGFNKRLRFRLYFQYDSAFSWSEYATDKDVREPFDQPQPNAEIAADITINTGDFKYGVKVMEVNNEPVNNLKELDDEDPLLIVY